jgi:hypothetical protein
MWSIGYIKNTTGSNYEFQFDGKTITSIVWMVVKDCITHKAGTISNITSNIQNIDLPGVDNGTYFLKAECPTCKGFCFPVEFKVTHNGSQIGTPVLSAQGINATTIRIGWTYEGSTPVDFQLQYSTNGTTFSDVSGGIFGPQTRAWDTSPWTTDQLIHLRLRARDTNTNSEWSEVVTATATDDAVVTTPQTVPDFVFITNTTGYFDSDDFLNKITKLAPCSKVVRWCVRWDEYETSPGVFRDDKLANRMAQVDAIYAAQGLNPPHYAIDFWGVRTDSKIDQFLPYNDIVVFQGGRRATGDIVLNHTFGLGSFSSTQYRNRMATCGHNITKWFAENAPGRLFYTCLSTGHTEEFYNHLWVDYQNGGAYAAHGDFSSTAVASFRAYCQRTFGVTTPWGETSANASIPTADWSGSGMFGMAPMMSTPKGTAWTKWTNDEMELTVVSFKNGCKSADGNVKVIHFIADFYRQQANGWLVNSPSIYPLVEQLDGLYHSDGDTSDDNDFAKKYSSFDSMATTWGNKMFFCEMDWNDMYMFGTAMPSADAIRRTARAAYKKGCTGIHFAMSFTQAQAEYTANIANEILAEIQAGTLVRLDRTNAPNFTFNIAPSAFGGGDALLNFYKNTAGGTETNVVNVRLIDNT